MIEKDIIDIETPIIIGRFRYYSQRAKLMLKALFAIEPVIPNVIALILCAIALYILGCKNFIPDIGKYHKYFYNAFQLLFGYQVIISAKKSLLLPLVTIFSSIVTIAFNIDSTLVPVNVLRELVLLGLAGIAMSVFYLR